MLYRKEGKKSFNTHKSSYSIELTLKKPATPSKLNHKHGLNLTQSKYPFNIPMYTYVLVLCNPSCKRKKNNELKPKPSFTYLCIISGLISNNTPNIRQKDFVQ